MIAAARGTEVHLLGRGETSRRFAGSLGIGRVWRADTLPIGLRFDGVIDASNSPDLPSLAVELVEPGRRVAWIGIAGRPSPVDSRRLVLKDVTVVGILSGSLGLHGAIDLYASGAVDPSPLVAGVVGLDDVAGILAGERDARWGDAPKVHVDPRR